MKGSLGQRVQEWVILELFQEGEISAGKAAEMLGTSKARFIELLDRKHLPYLDASLEELERELAAAENAAR